MKRKVFIGIIGALLLLAGCGQSYEEQKRMTRQRWLQMQREDSAALKVAVMPTLDCLPFYVARDCHLFEADGVDIRLKSFTAQMDCDTALINSRVEVGVSDLVRVERMRQQGTSLDYLTATNAYWQLVTSRTARLKALRQLDDKMLAMTRYSATDLLGDYAVDSVRLKKERVFRIQVNDVHVRLKMLENKEMDALLLTEPQATQARIMKNPVLLDSRNLDLRLGVVAVRTAIRKDTTRQRQLDVLTKAYNQACDSINKYGVGKYRDLVMRYCKVRKETVDSLPGNLRFRHVEAPRPQDVERAVEWLKKQGG